jgi:hypothetical protein
MQRRGLQGTRVTATRRIGACAISALLLLLQLLAAVAPAIALDYRHVANPRCTYNTPIYALKHLLTSLPTLTRHTRFAPHSPANMYRYGVSGPLLTSD